MEQGKKQNLLSRLARGRHLIGGFIFSELTLGFENLLRIRFFECGAQSSR